MEADRLAGVTIEVGNADEEGFPAGGKSITAINEAKPWPTEPV